MPMLHNAQVELGDLSEPPLCSTVNLIMHTTPTRNTTCNSPSQGNTIVTQVWASLHTQIVNSISACMSSVQKNNCPIKLSFLH